jgi:hypothetical protein
VDIFADDDEARDYWFEVRQMERQAIAKAKRQPKCRTCRQPMWLDQERWNGGDHHTCKEGRS